MLYKTWGLFLGLIVVLLFVYYRYKNRETFFVAYNNSNVPINKQVTLDESDVQYLNIILNEYNTSGFPNIDEYTSQKKSKSSPPISDEMWNIISERVITTLKIIFSKGTRYRGDTLLVRKTESGEPFYDLYWKVIDNNIYCIFKMDIMNKEKGWARTFKIYLVMNGDIIIKTISLEEFSYFSFEGINENNEADPMYYKIENTLHLMDPYLTSGREMKITDKMRQNFDNALKKKYI